MSMMFAATPRAHQAAAPPAQPPENPRARGDSRTLQRVDLAIAALATTALLAPAVATPSTPAERACARAAASLVPRWIDAYNTGDMRRLDRIFAPAGVFVWYSSPAPGVRLRAAAKDRSTLLPYFLDRHRAGDRLRIVYWKFNSRRARDDEGGFEFTLRRRARDYRGGRSFTLQGKGSVACARRQISVVSLGGPG
jgi:hypothetical protein